MSFQVVQKNKKEDGIMDKRKKILICLGVVVLCVVAYLVGQGTKPVGTGAVTVGTSTNTVSYEFEDEQERAGGVIGDSIKIPGYDLIAVDAGETKIKGDFFNPEENNVYFKMIFQIADTEEIIFESDLIKPGQHLYEIELLRTIDVGEYDLDILYQTFSTDGNFTPLNGANLQCKLEVA